MCIFGWQKAWKPDTLIVRLTEEVDGRVGAQHMKMIEKETENGF